MDFTDPKFWTDGLGVVRNAPQIVGPLVVLAAGAGYWLKSAWAKSEKEGLLQRVGVLEERLRLWKEREEDVRQKLDESEKKRDERPRSPLALRKRNWPKRQPKWIPLTEISLPPTTNLFR